MPDPIAGYLEVGINQHCEVVINITRETLGAMKSEKGGHLMFTPKQARDLAALLLRKAKEAESRSSPVSPS